MRGGWGGGDRSPTSASKGRLPKPSIKQFTRPMAVVNDSNPKLLRFFGDCAPKKWPLPALKLGST
jgi:hypothetical protein